MNLEIKSEVPYNLNLELEELKKPFNGYIIKEIDTQIELADDKNEKITWIIDRLKSAASKIDFELINENPRGSELKGIAKACANTCFRILTEFNDFAKTNEITIKEREEFDLLYLFENDNIIDKGFKLPKIRHSTHHAQDEFEKRLICKKYWIKKLRNTIKQNRWMIFAFLGAMGKSRAKYCNIDGVEQYKETRKAQEDFLNNTVARNTKTGEEIKLSTFAENGHTRFSQLHRMSVGIENIAKDRKMVSAMITLTVPGEFHINAGNGSNEWELSNFANYKESNNLIAERWQKVLMRLNKSETAILGLRVSESHRDGTPHWHAIIYFKKKHVDRIKNALADVWGMSTKTIADNYSKTGKLLKKKTITTSYHNEGSHVVNKSSIAVQWIDIDPKKGRASSYIVKYISKNLLYNPTAILEHNNVEEKNKFNKDFDNFLAVAANRSTWNTRAFQFFGVFKGAITLWKQYRKQRNKKIDNDIEMLRINAACEGNFKDFLYLMEDENQRPKLRKIEKTNVYGGITKTIIGYDTADSFYQTKFDDYKLDTKKIIGLVKVTYNDPRKASKNYNISVNKENIIKIINKIKRNRSSKRHLGDFLGTSHISYADDPIFWV